MPATERFVVLPSVYLGPVSYYARLMNRRCLIDLGEHFIKQTYRNRCTILSPSGRLDLIIPVAHSARLHRSMKDVELSPRSPWQRAHWHALRTCYDASPYFEFYAPDLEPLYRRPYRYLADFNEALRALLCRWLFIDGAVPTTLDYTRPLPADDCRPLMSPKRSLPDSLFRPVPYPQLFIRDRKFEADLSIVDLLFNLGPEAMLLLRRSLFGGDHACNPTRP